VGVVIFLVVSGFLLYRPFVLSHLAGDASPRAGAYAWRRVLRVVPAFWVALAVATLIVPYHGVFTLGGVPTYFGFAQIYRGSTIASADPPAWTLGLEVSFYAFLPLWALALRRLPGRDRRARLRIQVAGIAGLWLFSMAYKAILLKTGVVPVIPVSPLPALVMLPGYLDEFALGMGLAVASAWCELTRSEPRAVRLVGRRPWLAWAFGLAAFLLVSFGIGLSGDPGQGYSPSQYLARNVLYGAVAVGVIAPAIFGDGDGDGGGGLVRRVLSHRALLWIGLISYGIYLWHAPLLSLLLKWHYSQSGPELWRYVRWAVVPLVGAVALGAASYYLVERPALLLKRIVPAPPTPPADASTASAPAPPAAAPAGADGPRARA
jgi:peptidoglycan/LPS O-acetylase OafA/YrhL